MGVDLQGNNNLEPESKPVLSGWKFGETTIFLIHFQISKGLVYHPSETTTKKWGFRAVNGYIIPGIHKTS